MKTIAVLAMVVVGNSLHAQVTWLGTANFNQGPAVNGGGVLTIAPTINFVNLPNGGTSGFRLTDVNINYSIAAVDLGQDLDLSWSAFRQFSVLPKPFSPWYNQSALDGSISFSEVAAGNLALNSMTLRTFTPDTDIDLGVAAVGPSLSDINFNVTHVGGPWTQFSDQRLWQNFNLKFHVSATATPGDSFTLLLPGSAGSYGGNTVVVPEPSSSAMVTFALIGASVSVLWRQRRTACTR